MTTKIYSQIKLRNVILRKFNSNTNPKALLWHKDNKDRIVIPIFSKGWYFQFDNELPFKLNRKINIQKNRIHRIIKTTNTTLLILIVERQR